MKPIVKNRINRGIQNPERAVLYLVIKLQNWLMDLIKPKNQCSADLLELKEIKLRTSHKRTDISDHLETLFVESLSLRPKLIVELGVRSGESNFALERVARLCNSKIISVDLDDCSKVSSYLQWYFILKDDIEFAKEFKAWCGEKEIIPKIDVLFIDTSHFFKHTTEEIKHWFPFLSDRAKVFFHDTRLRTIYSRKDGSLGLAYHQRGVKRAIEQFLGRRFNENHDFVTYWNGWLIKHYSNCNGLTILEKGFL